MILIVDDDPAFLEKARQVLNRDRQVFLASTSRQAYTLAQDLGFSVVLVDLNLSGGDGITLIRKIRANVPGLPIVAITEDLDKATRELAQDLGVAEVLKKPVTTEWKPVVDRVRALRQRG